MSQKYKVLWRRRVLEGELAAIVVRAMEEGQDVSALTFAMERVDQLLCNDPKSRGESRGEFERVLIVPPLTITFEVHEEERIVFVLSVRFRPITSIEEE